MLDFTHDPSARSWVEAANTPDTDFPIQNLPLGVSDGQIVIAIGDQALNLQAALDAGLLPDLPAQLQAALRTPRLNGLFSLGRPAIRQLRHAAFKLLKTGDQITQAASACLIPQEQFRLQLPCDIGGYSDFFTSFNHAYNCGVIFRRDQPVQPNFHSMPIAYHGRASSIVVSGTPVVRPHGQSRVDASSPRSRFGPSQRMDFEMELGAVIGKGNALGSTIPVDDAEAHIAGLCLLNDWSARDVQSWEAQPLGPFLAKNFMSTVSPWVVTLDALEPYRAPAAPRRAEMPPVHEYLAGSSLREPSTYEIHTEVRISTPAMRKRAEPPMPLSRALFSRDSVWTFSQMVAHHTVNGCNLVTGDLLGSGTISGPEPGSEGCLLELTRAGEVPVQLASGEARSFLEDGDEVSLTAWCARPGLPRIGLGTCIGRIMPAAATVVPSTICHPI